MGARRKPSPKTNYPVYIRNSDGAPVELVYDDETEVVIRPPGCPTANKIMSHATLKLKFSRVVEG